MPRGILATITMKLLPGVSKEQVRAAYQSAYSQEEFVSLLPETVLPKTASVLGSNSVSMQVAIDEHTNRLVVSVAIDNLVKGAAGQAIQNANIMCGLSENLGLTAQGIGA
jgi:N-acetyl-gamma-glutamyl-phosphate reductase